jgi:hypothetical protein
LMEETRVPRENNRPAASHWETLSHNAVSMNAIRTSNFSGVRHWLHIILYTVNSLNSWISIVMLLGQIVYL